jgi:pimeloyl-ACP methyl ester carboxylesterase
MREHAVLEALAAGSNGRSDLSEGLNELKAQDGQLFYVYISVKAMIRPKASRILVSVHGYSGRKNNQRGRKQVKKYAEYWSGLADERGWVILAPHFDEKTFKNDYQRLNPTGPPADLRLNDLIWEVGRLLPELPTDRVFLFGFSGGGQFVHRYVAFEPERVIRAVAGAPGWYMWPVSLSYPIGAYLDGMPATGNPLLERLCSASLLILVGEKDSTQRVFRKRFQGHDLMKMQGNGRKERALNWVAAMKKWAQDHGRSCNISCMTIPNVAHSVNKRIFQLAGSYLCGDLVPM